MEKDFLLYLIYMALLDIRARSYENNDRVSHGLCDLLHNIPPALIAEETGQNAYENFLKKVEDRGMETWLDSRKEEFHDWYAMYKK